MSPTPEKACTDDSLSQQQATFSGCCDWPFQTALDGNNRWVRMSRCIPWDELAEGYYQALSVKQGRPAKDARLVIGAVIIKHKLCLSDRETVAQIRENPYLQYFVGLSGYQMEAPFAPSLLVEIRKRMGAGVFEIFYGAVIEALERAKAKRKPAPGRELSPSKAEPQPERNRDEPSSTFAGTPQGEEAKHQGKLIVDATVAEQAIRYPTDLGLLNEAREFSERIIDKLYPKTGLRKKPRIYRQQAHKAYLGLVKQRRPGKQARRRGIKQQLQYLRRNLGHIERLLDRRAEGGERALPRWLLARYGVIREVYEQQREMYQHKTRRCEHRIVSISQPHVRPIVRGKPNRAVEFGAKLSVSLTGEGLARVDHLRWDAFAEGKDLESQVEAYRRRYGYYPQVLLGDTIYGTRENRRYLKGHGIRFAGKALGQLQAQRREDYRQRIPIEGKFGQGKNGYRLNRIRAKRGDTSAAWINSIFLVMNLLILLRIFFVLIKKSIAEVLLPLLRAGKRLFCYRQAHPTAVGFLCQPATP
jgi:hypothetical protein